MDTTTTASEGLPPQPIPVRPVFDFNVRLASVETLAKMATEAAPGSAQRLALLAELERRRVPVVLLPVRDG